MTGNDAERNTIRAVAFDFDGLMFNTEELFDVVGDTVLERRGHKTRPEVVAQMMGRQAKEALQIMIDAYGLESTVAELEAESAEVFLSLVPKAEPMPGCLDLLAALEEASIPRGITTSSRPELIEPILERFGMLDRFAFRLTSCDIAKSKPDPEIYLTGADRFSIRPEQLLVLEDSQVGCAAAVAASAFAVAVPSRSKGQTDFPGAALVVDSLESREIYAALGLE